MDAGRVDDGVRLAELMATLSLVTDLGLGRPPGRELAVCLAALDLADRLGCPAETRSEVYYVALVAHLGCTAAAPHLAQWVGGDEIHLQRQAQVVGPMSEPSEDLRFFARDFADDRPLPERARRVGAMLARGQGRFARMAADLCDGGRVLAERLRLPAGVALALGQFTERWDGKGFPGEAAGEAISPAMRIVRVAHDFLTLAHARDLPAAVDALGRRRGRGYDPAPVDAALADPQALLRLADVPDGWERVIAAEPPPVATVSSAGVASVARAFGEFADVKVAFLHGHSARVAELAATAGEALGCAPRELRVAGLLHDLGRVAVANGIWDKPGPLSAAELELVRLHPYYTARVLERSGALAPVAPLAAAHHERLDGSGYHRAATAAELSLPARVLAAADVYDAMTHARPFRPALADPRAGLADTVAAGALDRRAVNAVLEAAGEAAVRVRQGYPAGLSEREVEVLRLVAQGRSNKQIARELVISEKTAGHHVEHIYAKAGVSTRVGAALFAMRHDLAG